MPEAPTPPKGSSWLARCISTSLRQSAPEVVRVRTCRRGRRGGRVNGGCSYIISTSLRQSAPDRRIYRRGFTELTREGISALGSLPLSGNSKFYLRRRSFPGVNQSEPPLQPYSGFDGWCACAPAGRGGRG